MKSLIFILGFILLSCGDDEVLNVFIEDNINQTNDSNKKQITNPKSIYNSVFINGTIKNGNGTTVRLESPLILNKIALDSAVIDENDRFTINASIPEDYGYYVLRLLNNSNDSIEIPLKGGDTILFNTSKTEFKIRPNIQGVSWSQEANEFIEKKRNRNSDLARHASKLMKENINSPYNIVLSKYFIGSEKDINESKIGLFQDVTQAFMDSLPSSLATKNFVSQLDLLVDIRSKTLNLNKGDYMIKYGFYDVPGLILNQPNGSEIKLSDLRGKTVLVDFWASWCGPCRKENPNVVKLYQKYRKKNFTVFSVSLDEDASNWKQAIKSDQLIWPYHGSELKGWNSSFVSKFNIKSIPFTVLVDPKGKIIGVNLIGEDLENRLYELFKF